MTAGAIEVAGARIVRGGRAVLDEVTLSIGEGEFIGVLGPNGAGKTTLLRALLGLVPPARGSIRVLGQPVRRGDPRIGYLPQSLASAATGRLSGRAVIASACAGHRWGLPWPNAAARRDVARVLEAVDGAGLADRPFAELSGGERQRLRLAQALLSQPRLLLLDEPLAGLDPHHQQAVVALVRQVQQAFRLTVLFTAHDVNPLLGAMDRVLYLGGGQAALGTVAEVINGAVLSRLYGAAMEVLQVRGRVFVLTEESTSFFEKKEAKKLLNV